MHSIEILTWISFKKIHVMNWEAPAELYKLTLLLVVLLVIIIIIILTMTEWPVTCSSLDNPVKQQVLSIKNSRMCSRDTEWQNSGDNKKGWSQEVHVVPEAGWQPGRLFRHPRGSAGEGRQAGHSGSDGTKLSGSWSSQGNLDGLGKDCQEWSCAVFAKLQLRTKRYVWRR